MFIDFHIELSSIIAYFNDQVLSGRQMPATAKQLHENAIHTYLTIPHKPFLVVAQADNDYYKRYLQESVKEVEKIVPDFFEHEGDFYDLNETHYIRREDVGDEVFGLFFQLKLEEIQDSNKTHLAKFYDFQLYDNFYGNKDEFDNFLMNLPATADNCWQLPEVSHGFNLFNPDAKKSTEDSPSYKSIDDEIEQMDDWEIYLSSRRGYLIPCIWTEDEVKAFFSFLYRYKSAIGESLLSEEEFDTIFQHGLRIPAEPLVNKISLRNTPQIPKRLLDAGIHLFWNSNGRTAVPKSDLLLFFANFLKQYEEALLSRQNLNKILSNIKKYTDYPELKFKKYMPSRIVL